MHLGSGAYGSVFSVAMDEHRCHYARKYFVYNSDMKHVAGLAVEDKYNLPVHAQVAVKIILLPQAGNTTMRALYAALIREIEVSTQLCQAAPIRLKNQHTYDVASVVPKVYYAGVDEQSMVGVLIMEQVKGISLNEFEHKQLKIQQKKFPDWVLVNVEYALACLYLNGYLHMDLHTNNIIIDESRRKYKVKLIDFGIAVKLDDTYTQAFRELLENEGTKAIDDFHAKLANDYGNQAVVARKAKYQKTTSRYHKNSSIIKALRKVTVGNDLLKLRYEYWALKTDKEMQQQREEERRRAERELQLRKNAERHQRRHGKRPRNEEHEEGEISNNGNTPSSKRTKRNNK